MQLSYLVIESLNSLRTNPLRSALSIVGVVFGVASVVAMLSIGLGAQSEVDALLSALGAQNIHVTSNDLGEDEWRRVIASTTGLSARDHLMIEQLLPEAQLTDIGKWSTGDVNHHLVGPKLNVYGVSANYNKVLGLRLMAGRTFSDFEAARAAPVAVLGQQLARDWFGEPAAALGQEIRVNRSWLHVIGVLATTVGAPAPAPTDKSGKPAASPPEAAHAGQPGAPAQSGIEAKMLGLGNALVTPFKTGQTRLGPLSAVGALERIVVKLPKDADPTAIRKRLETNLDRLHRGAKVLAVVSADEVIEQRKATARLFTYFLMTIALISLVVGGIGIANVMLASMVERIREVGLRRAIGAKRRQILWQFLSEAICICILGGIFGGLTGIGVALGAGAFTGWKILIPWWGMLVAVVIATIVGTLAGLYPAVAASRISPIEALQGRA